MKTYSVYELYNSMGTVEYVGESSRPKVRFIEHTKNKPTCRGHGKFYGRPDITMNIVAEFQDRKEAMKLEGELKLQYGLEWTEKTRQANGGKIGGKICGKLAANRHHLCPHCGKEGKGMTMLRYHFNNCKHKPVE
jgi:predicted GIY-YIG superfamily endonuclease